MAAGKYLLSEHTSKNFETTKGIIEALAQAIKGPVSSSMDTKRLALVVIRTLGRLHEDVSGCSDVGGGGGGGGGGGCG